MRFAFWIGYRIDPLYRAFGFAATMWLNLLLLGAAPLARLYLEIDRDIAGKHAATEAK